MTALDVQGSVALGGREHPPQFKPRGAGHSEWGEGVHVVALWQLDPIGRMQQQLNSGIEGHQA